MLLELIQSGVLIEDDFKAFAKALWRKDNNISPPSQSGTVGPISERGKDQIPPNEEGKYRNRVDGVFTSLHAEPAATFTKQQSTDMKTMVAAFQNWLAGGFFSRFESGLNGTQIPGQENVCAVPFRQGQWGAFLQFLRDGQHCK